MYLLAASLPKHHRIILAGDRHYGTVASHEKGWQAMLGRLKREKNTYLFLGGDLIEAIAVDDKRFEAEVHDARHLPFDQMGDVVGELKPVAKKVVGVLEGNHEAALGRYGNLTKWLCKEVGAPYGGYTAKLSVEVDGNLVYKIAYTHRRLSVRSVADDPLRRRRCGPVPWSAE